MLVRHAVSQRWMHAVEHRCLPDRLAQPPIASYPAVSATIQTFRIPNKGQHGCQTLRSINGAGSWPPACCPSSPCLLTYTGYILQLISAPLLHALPSLPISPSRRIYFLLAFSNYLSELLGTWLCVSTIPLKSDMVLHHMLTMTLISVAYHVNLVRYGVMWMALFDLR